MSFSVGGPQGEIQTAYLRNTHYLALVSSVGCKDASPKIRAIFKKNLSIFFKVKYLLMMKKWQLHKTFKFYCFTQKVNDSHCLLVGDYFFQKNQYWTAVNVKTLAYLVNIIFINWLVSTSTKRDLKYNGCIFYKFR